VKLKIDENLPVDVDQEPLAQRLWVVGEQRLKVRE
jgi:hypothetical protein